MFYSKAHRIIDGITAVFFLGLASLLFVLAAHVPYHDGNYAGFYLGAGVLLECIYLAVHFGLKAILFSRIRLAEKISQVVGLLLLVPIGLIILALALLLEQSIRMTSSDEPEVQITNWVFGSLVLFLLVVPAILICRNIVIAFLRRRSG